MTAQVTVEGLDLDGDEHGPYLSVLATDPAFKIAAQLLDPPSEDDQCAGTSDNEGEDDYVPSGQDSDSDRMDIDNQATNVPTRPSKLHLVKHKGKQHGTSSTQLQPVKVSATVGVGKRKKDGDAEPM